MKKKQSKRVRKRFDESIAILLIAIAGFIFFSLYSYDTSDLSFYTTQPNEIPNNYIGLLGAWISFVLINGFGLGSFLVPFIFLLWGVRSFFQQDWEHLMIKILSSFLFFLSGIMLLQIQTIFSFSQLQVDFALQEIGLGGIVGTILYNRFLMRLLGVEGCYILFGSVLIASFLIITEVRIKSLFLYIKKGIILLFNALVRSIRFTGSFYTRKKVKKGKKNERIYLNASERKVDEPTVELTRDTRKEEEKHPLTERKESLTDKQIISYKKENDTVSLPSINLLASPDKDKQTVDPRSLQKTAEILQKTLLDFSVEVKVINVSRGPVITQYELLPAPGVKIQKIETLSKDIALALKVGGVRVVAPIPGKGTVGIEVPNSQKSIVVLQELIASNEFRNQRIRIPLALGKDVSGAIIVSDLVEMPHLLIAGATGSGKSVCINSIILSVLFRLTPQQARFLMIDPKMVELPVYDGIPHQLSPVVTDPKKAAAGLCWVVSEMERRYKIFAKIGVRNLEQYNARITGNSLITDDEGNNLTHLPFIIVIIDELADLMLVAAVEIENSIARLAQLSRAVGIHLVLATQRPSVDVITGVIKANFPTRISFQVSSKVDSRTVLDANGADMLIGKGDMLFMPPGSSKIIRGQGAFVSDSEIRAVIHYMKSQNVEDTDKHDVFREQLANGGMSSTEYDDELIPDAIEVVKQTGQASVSILQRRLRVGYTRAARIMDSLEEQGVVGPYNGSKARDILIDTYT
ncbi:DNA translocase FtsK [Chlamydiota bacterium]